MTMIKNYDIGNGQTIGSGEIQSNYFSTVFNNAGNLFAVLADGGIDHQNGRKAAILAVEFCVDAFLMGRISPDKNNAMYELALKVNRRLEEVLYMDRSPKLSLTIVLIRSQELFYFNAGSNRIYYYDGMNERSLDGDIESSHSLGKLEMIPGDVVGMYSAGVHTITHPMERIEIAESSDVSAFDRAQAVIETVIHKGLQNQLNATVLLIEVNK